jgi:hypothetical protein
MASHITLKQREVMMEIDMSPSSLQVQPLCSELSSRELILEGHCWSQILSLWAKVKWGRDFSLNLKINQRWFSATVDMLYKHKGRRQCVRSASVKHLPLHGPVPHLESGTVKYHSRHLGLDYLMCSLQRTTQAQVVRHTLEIYVDMCHVFKCNMASRNQNLNGIFL